MSARCVDCLNEAIERCEVTGVPLCAGCLWYDNAGRRISERVAKQLHTQGITVISPDIYLDQLGVAARLPSLPIANYALNRTSNGNDVVAASAAVTGLLSIASCFSIGFLICAPLPLLPLLLGGIGLAGSKNAARPDQARFLSWVGVAGGAGFVLVMMMLWAALGTTFISHFIFGRRSMFSFGP